MPLTKELDLNAKDEIVKALNDLVDRYLKEGVMINDIKRYFKPNKNFNILLKDIHYAGRKYFQENENYHDYVRKVFNDLILDRISEIETSKITTEKVIVKYNNFINESLNFDEVTIDYLFNNMEYSQNDMDIIADFFDTRKDYIRSKDPKYCLYTVTDFKTDILNNDRTTIDVLILSDTQIVKMVDNLVRYIVSGVYSKIPQDVEYMGFVIKPYTVMDKSAIRDSVKKMVTDQDVLNLITKLTNYKFESKYGNYYIWKKAK